MAYQVKYTETTNPAKPSITVEDQTLDTSTSLTFVGKNYAGYAPIVAENFLHLLENFAKTSAPANPVQGQLWYDNTVGVNLLKVFDGTTWTAAGSVKKASVAPLVNNSLKGDLWVDTANQQLYIFSGSSWLLVGPQFSAGLKTGPQIESIVDTDNVSHNVVSFFSEDYRIAIVSKASFTPKSTIAGFTTVGQGLNISTVDATSTTAPTKMWGTASQADALVVNGSTVNSANFLRSDQVSTTNYAINVRSNGGISVGSDLNFNIGTETNTTVLFSKTSGNSIDIKLNNAGAITTAMHIDADAKIGVGPNNSNPATTLDVEGSLTVSDEIIVTGTVDSTALGVGSIRTNGGLSIAKKSQFGDEATFAAKISLNNLDVNDVPVAGPILVPGTDSAAETYDIGSEARPFRNVYAQSIGKPDGTTIFTGQFEGAFSGDTSGTAGSLQDTTVFRLRGQITSTDVPFNGVTETGIAVFQTSVTPDIITTQTPATDSLLADTILMYRSGVGAGLRSITKQQFIANIPSVPPGAIFPFAGASVPNGYLLCDGSEVKISDFPTLFGVIGYTYKTASLLIGAATFALPDLRGRFPLGRDDMNNGRYVPSKDNITVSVPAGGGSANSVTNVLADTLGAKSGSEQTTLDLSNLPQHQHDLSTNSAQYYAAGIPGAPSDPQAEGGYGLPNSSTGSGLPNSGGIDTDGRLGQPFTTMNPFTTINYIIFTGTIS